MNYTFFAASCIRPIWYFVLFFFFFSFLYYLSSIFKIYFLRIEVLLTEEERTKYDPFEYGSNWEYSFNSSIIIWWSIYYLRLLQCYLKDDPKWELYLQNNKWFSFVIMLIIKGLQCVYFLSTRSWEFVDKELTSCWQTPNFLLAANCVSDFYLTSYSV